MVSTFRENVTSADADESRAREPRSADFIEGKREREKERERILSVFCITRRVN
jgi:hypothetical protein